MFFYVRRRFGAEMQIRSFETAAIEAKRFSKSGEKVMNIKIENNSAITQISKLHDRRPHNIQGDQAPRSDPDTEDQHAEEAGDPAQRRC